MKKHVRGVLVAGLCCVAATGAVGQFGANYFKKPNIANIFHPVVGEGSVFQMTEKDGTTREMTWATVAKDSVDGKEAYWIEMTMNDKGRDMVAKMLFTKDDFQYHKMIMMMPKMPQPMEMDMTPSAEDQKKNQDELSKWHSVGTETITVPAGTFSCDHWKKDTGDDDVWASPKVTPLGLVKQQGKNSSMVLIKQVSGVTDKITGTPMKMDGMMQQMMKNRNQ